MNKINYVLLIAFCLLQREQLQDHEQRVARLAQDLDDHRSHPPDRGAKSRVIHEFNEKEAFLQYEVTS